jgi:uncharacterized spore protein YtfJ
MFKLPFVSISGDTMALADVIKTALEQIQTISKTETIVGEPIIAGDIILIPVSRVSIGFAAGGGGKDEKFGSGAGTGGGINITPVAFISVIAGKVQVHSLSGSEPSAGLNQIMSMAPDIIKKISKYLKKKDEVKEEEKK